MMEQELALLKERIWITLQDPLKFVPLEATRASYFLVLNNR
jgi:hypothetical protein